MRSIGVRAGSVFGGGVGGVATGFGAAAGFGAACKASVNAWGDLYFNGKERLRWFVAADDRWYRPSRETTVRQRQLSNVPVIETRIKVPGGDAVHRIYGVADFGGVVVVEIYNDSSLPFAVAFDRSDIAMMREPSPAGVQGIDLPGQSVVFPVGHHASLRVAVAIDGDSRRISARQVEKLPSFEQVERGWLSALQVSSRVDVPEPSWGQALTIARCELLLSAAADGDMTKPDFDPVDFLLETAERSRLGENFEVAPDVSPVAAASEQIVRDCAKRKQLTWVEDRALLSAGMFLHRVGERRAVQDLNRAWSKLVQVVAPGADIGGSPGASRIEFGQIKKMSSVRQIAWVESQLVANNLDRSVNVCPRGIDQAWVGANFECHNLMATPEHSVSFAVRWHGDKPALLWEVHGPSPVKVVATAIDDSFVSAEMRGETLLRGFVSAQNEAVK